MVSALDAARGGWIWLPGVYLLPARPFLFCLAFFLPVPQQHGRTGGRSVCADDHRWSRGLPACPVLEPSRLEHGVRAAVHADALSWAQPVPAGGLQRIFCHAAF